MGPNRAKGSTTRPNWVEQGREGPWAERSGADLGQMGPNEAELVQMGPTGAIATDQGRTLRKRFNYKAESIMYYQCGV